MSKISLTRYRVSLLFVFLIFTTNQYLAQCPTGAIVLNSQIDVNLLSNSYPNCTQFPEGITISGNDITNLDGLSHVVSIGRNLEIENNPVLTDISGLLNLETIGNDLHIRNNPDLRSLDGLQLVSDLTDLTLSNLNSLSDLNGLQGLASIERIFIVENTSLEQLTGLNNLESIKQYFEIRANSLLQSLVPLTSADLSEMYRINLTDNPLLTGCDVEKLCDYIALGNDDIIAQNGMSCESAENISAVCESVCSPGSPCDDDDDNTSNDVLGEDCICSGTPPEAGDSCDDGDEDTENDIIQEDGFTCSGTPVGGEVDCELIQVSASENRVMIRGLPTVNSEVQLLNEQLEVVYFCAEDCQEEITIADLPGGNYELKILVYNTETVEIVCDLTYDIFIACMEDADMDGVCAAVDCDDNDPSVPAAPGTSCDDGDLNTTFDIIQNDSCTCAGVVMAVQRNCDAVTIQTTENHIYVSGLGSAPHAELEVFDAEGTKVYGCNGNCMETEHFLNPGNGKYLIRVRLFDSEENLLCESEEPVVIKNTITIIGSGPNFEISVAIINSPDQLVSAVTKKINQASQLKIYPNPASVNDRLIIQLYGLDKANSVLRIFNNLGKLTAQNHFKDVTEINYELDITNYSPGIYLITLEINGVQTTTDKLIIH